MLDDGSFVELEVLDGASDSPIAPQWIYHLDAVMLVYSITDRKSFEAMDGLRNQIIQHKPLPIILLANKGDEDEQRVVTSDEGVDLAARWNESVFFEVSARTRMSLDEALKEVIHEIKSQQEAFIDVPWFSAVPKWSFEE